MIELTKFKDMEGRTIKSVTIPNRKSKEEETEELGITFTDDTYIIIDASTASYGSGYGSYDAPVIWISDERSDFDEMLLHMGIITQKEYDKDQERIEKEWHERQAEYTRQEEIRKKHAEYELYLKFKETYG